MLRLLVNLRLYSGRHSKQLIHGLKCLTEGLEFAACSRPFEMSAGIKVAFIQINHSSFIH